MVRLIRGQHQIQVGIDKNALGNPEAVARNGRSELVGIEIENLDPSHSRVQPDGNHGLVGGRVHRDAAVLAPASRYKGKPKADVTAARERVGECRSLDEINVGVVSRAYGLSGLGVRRAGSDGRSEEHTS